MIKHVMGCVTAVLALLASPSVRAQAQTVCATGNVSDLTWTGSDKLTNGNNPAIRVTFVNANGQASAFLIGMNNNDVKSNTVMSELVNQLRAALLSQSTATLWTVNTSCPGGSTLGSSVVGVKICTTVSGCSAP